MKQSSFFSTFSFARWQTLLENKGFTWGGSVVFYSLLVDHLFQKSQWILSASKFSISVLHPAILAASKAFKMDGKLNKRYIVYLEDVSVKVVVSIGYKLKVGTQKDVHSSIRCLKVR